MKVIVGFPLKVEQFFVFDDDIKDLKVSDVVDFVFGKKTAKEILPNVDETEARIKLFSAVYKLRSKIRLWLRASNGATVFVDYDFTPYFYVPASTDLSSLPNKIEKSIVRTEKVTLTDVETMRKEQFYRIYVKNTILFNRVKKHFEDTREDKVFFEQRFEIDSGMPFNKWLLVFIDETSKRKYNRYYGYKGIMRDGKPLFQVLDDDEVKKRKLPSWPPMRYFVFDIEVYNKYGMNPDKAPIIAIGIMLVSDYGDKRDVTYKSLHVNAPDGEENDLAQIEEEEKRILYEFTKIMRSYDPDIIIGHNSSQFDIPFILERMKKHRLRPVWGRLGGEPVVRVKKKMEGNEGFSNLEFTGWNIDGRIVADTLFISKRDIVGLNTYNLKDILESLGVRKKEERVIIPGHKLWKFWLNDRDLVIEYLKDDVEDTMKLWDYLSPLQKAYVKYLRRPLQEVLSMQTSNLVESIVLNKAYERGLIMPKRIYAKGGYSGAFVHYPKIGVSENVYVVDFRSLYPTTIITWNISIESYRGEMTKKEVEDKFGIKFKDDLTVFAFVKYMYEHKKTSYIAYYDQKIVDTIMKLVVENYHIFNVLKRLKEKGEKEKFESMRKKAVNIVTNELTKIKAVGKTQEVVDALIESGGEPIFTPALTKFLIYDASFEAFSPSVIKEVLFERFELKKRMKEEPDELKKKELNFQQNALKRIVNSAYGYYGYANAMMFRPHVAESITAGGRMTILHTVALANAFGFKSIYGDSVTAGTVVRVRKGKKEMDLPVEKLFDQSKEKYVARFSHKEYGVLDGYEALTFNEDLELEWKPIEAVIRHKTNKKVYRLKLKSGKTIEVTEDHSLIGYKDGRIIEVKPTEAELVLSLTNDGFVTVDKVISKEVIEYDGYVYDLTVSDNHNFIANGVIVHNTDSEFLVMSNMWSRVISEWTLGRADYFEVFKRKEEEVREIINKKMKEIEEILSGE